LYQPDKNQNPSPKDHLLSILFSREPTRKIEFKSENLLFPQRGEFPLLAMNLPS
jgi:hypothetical protein